MSLMLDALMQIEAKTSSVWQEDRVRNAKDSQALRLVVDSSQPMDTTFAEPELESSGERDIVSTLPFESASDIAQLTTPVQFSRPRDKVIDRAYVELAKTVLEQLPKGREVSILFTSPGDGEGKTNTVMGLAQVLASQNLGEVLVVDGNLRQPGLADWFDIEVSSGFAEVLYGEINWPRVIKTTTINNLCILPSRVDPLTQVCLRNNARVADLLDQLRREFQFVLFDGASLRYPEVAEMACLFDRVYLVMELNRTSQREARQAIRIIDDHEGYLLGCVLTNQI